MSSGSGHDESRPASSTGISRSHTGESAAGPSARSHASPSSSPSLSGLRSVSEHLPPLDLRLSESPSPAASPAFTRYTSNVTGHSSLPQFYVAVERPQFKLGTLKDLLEVLASRGEISVGICCGTRDVLDALVGAIAYETRFSIQCLHSDMAETDRSSVLAAFHAKKQSLSEPSKATDPSRGPTTKASPKNSSATAAPSEKTENSARDDRAEQESPVALQPELNILATTDACLPTAALGESPLLTKLMINYELPAKKEQYARRVGTILGPAAASALFKVTPSGSSPPRSSQPGLSRTSGGIVLSFVAAAEVGMLRSLEESLGFIIEEMPINILELL